MHEVYDHCMVYLAKKKQVMILGGTFENVHLKETWIFDLDQNNMPKDGPKRGPNMIYTRSKFGCTTFEHDEEEVVLVSGGRGAENKAEILLTSTEDWMPRKIFLWFMYIEVASNHILCR